MDQKNPMECEVCGGTDFNKEAGHFYCNECQTQSQQVQEHVFGDEALVTAKVSRKIQKDKSKISDNVLTSWECYNYVLRGLTQELISLGAKPSIKQVTRCLWMKYLHKCEVFDIHSDRPPKLSVLGPKKDMTILYGLKKRKRKYSRASSTSTSVSSRRQIAIKRRALIKNQYEELSQSQSLTQDSSMMSESLSGLKSDSETSESSSKIVYNKYSNSELKRMMSKNHWKKHLSDMEGDMTCHKFRAKSFRPKFLEGPTNLTNFTLYCLLYIALLIVGDEIQLGDMLRFIREGHLSFACYSHFFDEDLAPKALNLSQRKEKLFSHAHFRKRCAQIAQFLDISSYIETPNLSALCLRYCKELNLPLELFECAEKLLLKTAPKMVFGNRSKTIPNYEGRALSFVLFSLKLVFGLDGVTERKFSEHAQALNEAPADGLMKFDFLSWLEYVSYRTEVMKLHHLPTALKDCNSVDSDMYLSYLESQEIQFKGSGRRILNEVQDYLQVLDKVPQEPHDGITFKPSLTPFVDYTKLLLSSANEDILVRNFSNHSIDFLLRPVQRQVKHGGANDNIVTEELLYLFKSSVSARHYSLKPVAVKVSNNVKEDSGVADYLEKCRNESLRTINVNVFLSNWEEGNAKEFAINKGLLDLHTTARNINKEQYNAFERYWLNLPTNPMSYYFSKQDMKVIAAKFPQSLKLILEECSRIAEQDLCQFFSEFLLTELYLVYFGDFGCKSKKDRSKGPQEIRTTLMRCKRQW